MSSVFGGRRVGIGWGASAAGFGSREGKRLPVCHKGQLVVMDVRRAGHRCEPGWTCRWLGSGTAAHGEFVGAASERCFGKTFQS